MLRPAYVNIISYFYPLGNTPAVCLTQDLPRESDANVLLLGCGDVRNILFTTYADNGPDSRRLDVTCCDSEAAIIARNVILLTLITDGQHDHEVWSIGYHLYLDEASFMLVNRQAEALLAHSDSLEAWHGSKYGKWLRFCDSGTLCRIRGIWASYVMSDTAQPSYTNRFKMWIEKAHSFGHGDPQEGDNMTGLRSAGPISTSALKDMPILFRNFWKYGTSDGNSGLTNPNPTFFNDSEHALTLHYGTDPLLGFHLALAYAPLRSDSPLQTVSTSHSRLVSAAGSEFGHWAMSFRKSVQRQTIRFFNGDALSFCRALQHRSISKSQCNWYRDQYVSEPLILDGEDYDGDAPLLFNVIDTSNLADHLGGINLLTVASPLLDGSGSAVMYVDTLIKKDSNLRLFVDGLLCGNAATLCTLFGLTPTEYWTNSTVTSSVEDHVIDIIEARTGEKMPGGQVRNRLVLKRLASENIHFEPSSLAHLLYRVYYEMFQHEDRERLLSRFDLQKVRNACILYYHRGSFVAFLACIKRIAVVDWDQTLDSLLARIGGDTRLLVNGQYMQELYVQLHLQGLLSVSSLRLPASPGDSTSGLGAWSYIPPVVCVTLAVPRSRLKVFDEIPRSELGTPILHGMLQASSNYQGRPWLNVFAMVQLIFGSIKVEGSKEDTRITMSEDSRRWSGTSALFVSFLVPSWVMLLEPRDATVALGIQLTPLSAITFVKRLGIQLNIFKTTLADADHVFVTRYQPNLSGHPSPIEGATAEHEQSHSLTFNLNATNCRINSMTKRVKLQATPLSNKFKNGAKVKTTHVSPCVVDLKIATEVLSLHFPLPIMKVIITRVARLSSYIEVVVALADPREGNGTPRFMHPVLAAEAPRLWNMPCLNLDCLPILDVSRKGDLAWLNTHIALMWSSRERRLLEASRQNPNLPRTDVRVDLKASLYLLFMHFSGLQGEKARIFGVNNHDGGGVHILIFVFALRLDLSNRTPVLDCAVLPLFNDLIPKIGPFLQEVTSQGLMHIKVDTNEMRFWKEILPAWIERCRTWEHRRSCELTKSGKMPISLQEGENCICSCGNGSLSSSDNFGLARWKMGAEYAVRAAISPSFSVPFVEKAFEGVEKVKETQFHSGCRTCGREKAAQGDKSLLKCARCQAVRYCSAQCQRSDWQEHKKGCKKPAS